MNPNGHEFLLLSRKGIRYGVGNVSKCAQQICARTEREAAAKTKRNAEERERKKREAIERVEREQGKRQD